MCQRLTPNSNVLAQGNPVPIMHIGEARGKKGEVAIVRQGQ